MRRAIRYRTMSALALVWLCAATVALGATAPAPKRTPHAAPATPRAKSGAPHAKRAASATPHAKTGTAGPRRLEDVTIEGEVPVPQVLFVTARNQRRIVDFQHHRYLKNGLALGEATPLPKWVALPQDSTHVP